MNLLLITIGALFLLVAGTLLGRYYAPDRRPLRRAAQEGMSYVRGLVELLDGKDEAAIEEIKKALTTNTKTVEAYFALGSLFRNRGEHERAVRVHQTVLVRRDIDKATRLRVHHQLGLDFLAAGFHKRGVKALEYVLANDKRHQGALTALAKEYERGAQWERAAAVQRRLGKIDGESREQIVAHLLAQRARDLVEVGELGPARKALRKAVSADPKSVHVLFVLAEYELAAGKKDAAVLAGKKALAAAPELAAFFVPWLEKQLEGLDRIKELLPELDRLMAEHPENILLRLARARFVAKRDRVGAAKELEALLEQHPQLLPARREAARIALARGESDGIRHALSELLEVLGRADRGYRCGECGYATPDVFWRCSRCGAWGSVRVAWGRRATERTAA